MNSQRLIDLGGRDHAKLASKPRGMSTALVHPAAGPPFAKGGEELRYLSGAVTGAGLTMTGTAVP